VFGKGAKCALCQSQKGSQCISINKMEISPGKSGKDTRNVIDPLSSNPQGTQSVGCVNYWRWR
jgi:hypothetical protein